MAWIEMDWRPDRRHLRRFGAAALVALAAVGAWVGGGASVGAGPQAATRAILTMTTRLIKHIILFAISSLLLQSCE